MFKSAPEKAQEKIDKSLELIEVGINQESKELMEEAKAEMMQELLDDASNNQVLFVLAQANFHLGETAEATQRFKKAFERDIALGNDIYNFYQRLALLQSKMGHFEEMIKYQIIACDFKPGSRRVLAEKFFRDGSKNL